MCILITYLLACNHNDDNRPSREIQCDYERFKDRKEQQDWEAQYGVHGTDFEYRTGSTMLCTTCRFQEDHRRRSGQQLKWPAATKTQW